MREELGEDAGGERKNKMREEQGEEDLLTEAKQLEVNVQEPNLIFLLKLRKSKFGKSVLNKLSMLQSA